MTNRFQPRVLREILKESRMRSNIGNQGWRHDEIVRAYCFNNASNRLPRVWGLQFVITGMRNVITKVRATASLHLLITDANCLPRARVLVVMEKTHPTSFSVHTSLFDQFRWRSIQVGDMMSAALNKLGNYGFREVRVH